MDIRENDGATSRAKAWNLRHRCALFAECPLISTMIMIFIVWSRDRNSLGRRLHESTWFVDWVGSSRNEIIIIHLAHCVYLVAHFVQFFVPFSWFATERWHSSIRYLPSNKFLFIIYLRGIWFSQPSVNMTETMMTKMSSLHEFTSVEPFFFFCTLSYTVCEEHVYCVHSNAYTFGQYSFRLILPRMNRWVAI